MRAVDALIGLMRDTDIKASVIWFQDNGLNCSFEQLFHPLDIPRLTWRNARPADYILHDRPRKKNFFIPKFFEGIRFNSCLHEDEVTQRFFAHFDFRAWVQSHRRCYLSACFQFYPGDLQNPFASFVPVPALQEQIDERCLDFSDYTVGIHIRRTDNVVSIRESPTELFIRRMQEEIQHHPDVRFYVASDSVQEKRTLSGIFGDRIITASQPVSRSTVEGMQDAVVELYTLSRTQKIIGSHYSSFSEIAAEIGKISYEKIIRGS